MSDAVALELFDVLDEAAQELTAEQQKKPVSATSGARVFLENFYAQFFVNVLRVEPAGISFANASAAGLLLRKNRSWGEPRRKLLRDFHRLCKLEPNLRGGDYGGGRSVYRDFHRTVVPTVLRDIAVWAESEGLSRIAMRARDSADNYEAAAKGTDDE